MVIGERDGRGGCQRQRDSDTNTDTDTRVVYLWEKSDDRETDNDEVAG